MTDTQYGLNNLPAFIKNWKDAIEGGKSPQEIAQSCYHADAVLKGTIWSKAVQGHDDIIRYFESFTAGKNNPTVTFKTVLQSASGSFAGEYIFQWTDDNQQPQSAEANYTFEPTPNIEGQETISLHHSSFFVEKTL